MPKLSDLEELQAGIRLAAKDADPHTPSAEIASEFYEQNRELIASVADQWVLDKLSSLIRKERAKVRRDTNQQLVIEGMLGFRRLPSRIERRPGERISRSDATIADFRKLVAQLRREKSPALVEAINAVELMSRYSQRGGVPITWQQAIELEAAANRVKKFSRTGPRRNDAGL
jgi:hypothetical protein